jgi:hypothetical protein
MLIMEIIKDFLQDLQELFTAEYYGLDYERPVPRFPSVISFVFRLLIRFIWIVVPVIWIGMIVGCILSELPVIGVIITSLIATVLGLAALALLFGLMMALESFARNICCLILYKQLACGAENPIDDFITGMLEDGI